VKKLAFLSDTHLRHRSIKEFKDVNEYGQPKEPMGGDIVFHVGDALNSGTKEELEIFIKWYRELDFAIRIYVPGNHCIFCEEQEDVARAMCTAAGIIYLNDESFTVDGIKIYGMASTPWFFDWAFNRARTQAEADFRRIRKMKEFTDKIPEGTDILLTHGPAYGILDEVFRIDGTSQIPPRFVGCQDLLDAVKRVKPQIHAFGHIHSSRGEKHIDGTSFYNVSICNETYYPEHSPIFIDWDDK
jgi:Icc-related predicted phosphoesterase